MGWENHSERLPFEISWVNKNMEKHKHSCTIPFLMCENIMWFVTLKKNMLLLLQEKRGRKHVSFDETYWYLNRKLLWFYDDTPLKFNIAPQKEDVWETTFLFGFGLCSGAILPSYLDLDLFHVDFVTFRKDSWKKRITDSRFGDFQVVLICNTPWGVEKQGL